MPERTGQNSRMAKIQEWDGFGPETAPNLGRDAPATGEATAAEQDEPSAELRPRLMQHDTTGFRARMSPRSGSLPATVPACDRSLQQGCAARPSARALSR